MPTKGNAAQCFKLVLDGAASSERIVVQTPNGPEPQQKVLFNADRLAEVHDGKLQGIKAMLHQD